MLWIVREEEGIRGDGGVGTVKTREFMSKGLGKRSSLSGGYLGGKVVDFTYIPIVSRREGRNYKVLMSNRK